MADRLEASADRLVPEGNEVGVPVATLLAEADIDPGDVGLPAAFQEIRRRGKLRLDWAGRSALPYRVHR